MTRMSRADRRRWAAARTVPDLGRLIADWMEGSITSQPAYEAQFGPAEETVELIPTLAAANRAGYLTDDSQPGHSGLGYDGAHWEQRAAVIGFVGHDDKRLLDVLARTAKAAGLIVVQRAASDRSRDSIPVTTREGEVGTDYGHTFSARDLRHMWGHCCDPDAVRALIEATQVTLVDPKYGPQQRLWDVLADVAGIRRDPGIAARAAARIDAAVAAGPGGPDPADRRKIRIFGR
jgi:hypothetical protein